MSILFLMMAWVGASSAILQVPSSPLTDEEIQSLDPVGSCDGNGRSIDLHRVMFLENRTLDIDWVGGTLRLSVDGDNFYADEMAEGRIVRRHYRSIRGDIENGDGLDIQLKFGYFENVLVLYWRETFQNRIYRQGLFRVVGPAVTFLCAGEGGTLAVR